MYHIELFNNGERDYSKITGATGPLVLIFSSFIPFVEDTSSAYSGPSTLVAQEEAAFQATPEWQEYRNSLVSSTDRVAGGVLIPAEPSPESSDIDSDNQETSIERSSTTGVFY